MVKHKLHKHELRLKGWSEEEIAQTERVLERAEARKHPAIAVLDQVVYWLLLLVVIVGMAAFAIQVIPLILILDATTLAFILILMGISLGTLFTVVVQDIHWMSRAHHGFTLILLPVAAIAVFFLVLRYAGRTATTMAQHNITVVAVIFAAALLVPYIYHLLTDYKKRMRS